MGMVFMRLVCVWTLVITHTLEAGADVQFLRREEGESVLLPCALEPRAPQPFGVYLRRSWLRPGDVLFKYTKTEFSAGREGDPSRTSVSGDPSDHAVNVTISQLRPGDTDRYRCDFVVESATSADLQLPGTTDFFLLVTAGHAGGPEDIDSDVVQTCVGGSAHIPCPRPHGERGAVEGVMLKRRRGRAAVEVLYDSRRHHGSGPSPSPSQFPVEQVRLSSAPGPAGISYNLSLQQLQQQDAGFYSCQLLQHGRADGAAGLGRHAVFVSVGGPCSSSSSSVHIYTLSSAVGLLLLLLCLTVVVFRTRSQRSRRPCPQASVYEEMSRLQDAGSPRPPGDKQHTGQDKSSPENYYETPKRVSRTAPPEPRH